MNTTAPGGGDRPPHTMLHRASRLLIAIAGLGLVAATAPSGADLLPAIPDPVAPLGRDHPLTGQLVRLADRSVIEPRRFIEIATASRFILLGEKHDNPDHHLLQAWVIDALVTAGQRPAIAMEMLDSDQTQALAAYRANPAGNAAGLGAAIGWASRGWPDWSIYAPIAAAALRANLPIVPADLTRSQRRSVSRGGKEALDPGIRARIHHAPTFDERQSASLAHELRESHCGQLPEEALGRMMDVQWSRDAHMAAALIDAAALNGVTSAVLIAGAGHVRTDRGVPWHLARMTDPPQTLSLAFVEVDKARTDIADYALEGRFQFAWFTPRVDDEDPCAKFRDSLLRMRRP